MKLYNCIDLTAQLVQSLYHAENQLILALPRVVARVHNEELRSALREHLDETRKHSHRLVDVANSLKMPCAGRKCMAMEGLLKDGELAMGYGGDESLADSAVIGVWLAIEQYEATQYRALARLLDQIQSKRSVQLVTATFEEEEAVGKKLERMGLEVVCAMTQVSGGVEV
jgi:ferritin-like metal-binding protein YciE